MSTFVRLGKKVKHFAKAVLLPEPKCSVTYCRRIERVNEMVDIDWDSYFERVKIGLMLQFLQQ